MEITKLFCSFATAWLCWVCQKLLFFILKLFLKKKKKKEKDGGQGFRIDPIIFGLFYEAKQQRRHSVFILNAFSSPPFLLFLRILFANNNLIAICSTDDGLLSFLFLVSFVSFENAK